MEPDRYQQNHALYVTGIVFLIISLSLFAFTAYLLPYLLLKWHYDVPEFLAHWMHWLQFEKNYSETVASWFIFLFFLILALLAAAIAYKASNRIENKIYGIEVEENNEPVQVSREKKQTIGLLVKIILIVVLVFIGVSLFEWIIYIPPPQS